jgi:hypothetical protein
MLGNGSGVECRRAMSFSTTAAARQKEMKASIAVVAMRTFGARRLSVSVAARPGMISTLLK